MQDDILLEDRDKSHMCLELRNNFVVVLPGLTNTLRKPKKGTDAIISRTRYLKILTLDNF